MRHESRRPRPVRAAGGPADRGCPAAGARRTTRCWSGSTRRPSPGPTAAFRAAEPFFWRFFTGLLRPKRRIPGGVGRRGRGGRRGRHRVRGRRPSLRHRATGANAEYICVRESGVARAQAGRHELRGGRGRVRRSAIGAGVPAQARRSARGSSIVVYGASGSSARQPCSWRSTSGPRHGRLQHEEHRARALARRRRRRRLPARGLHEERRDVRRDLRRGRQALVPAEQALAEAGRDLHRDRPGLHVARPAAAPADPVDRRQEGDVGSPRYRRRTSSCSRS